MMMAHDCRLIMGPGRQGEVYGITALVPDGNSPVLSSIYQTNTHTDQMNEDPNAKQSWVSKGSLEKMLETFSEFPTWVTHTFK